MLAAAVSFPGRRMIQKTCGLRLVPVLPVLWLTVACGQAPAAETAPEPAAEIRLDPMWKTQGLANPESAALSADRTFLYVTNVNGDGEAKDGNGFIARVGVDGRLLDRDWAGGLNAPKGIMLRGGSLYVADIDEMVVIDAASGAVTRRVAAPGALFLNDLAFAPDGRVLIADSQNARIYAIGSDTAEVWAEGALLDSINGLYAEPGRLIVTTMAGRLLAIDYESRSISVLAEGLGDADGVAPLGHGSYLVSEWPGLLHVVGPDGTHRTVIDSRAGKIYMNDFLLVDDVLYQPNWEPGTVTAYRVVRQGS
jgi:DNA-binding beta-propeller fold protein YncE